MKSDLDGLGGDWASRGRTLAKDFLACLHVQNSSLGMVTGIEHWHTFVNGLFDDVVGIAGYLLGGGEQNCINHVNDSIRSFDVSLDHLRLVDHQGFSGRLDRNFRTIDGFGGVELRCLLRLHLAWDDMVGKDIHEFFVCSQV